LIDRHYYSYRFGISNPETIWPELDAGILFPANSTKPRLNF